MDVLHGRRGETSCCLCNSSVQSLSSVWLFATPWMAAPQASLSITNSQSCSNSCPLSQWCHPTISSSVVLFSSCLQSFPASGSFPMSQFLGSKITADGDCSHKIKRHLLLGRKAMTNLDSILKSRDITLPTKVHLVKVMVFPVVMYGYESWTIKKAERWRTDAFVTHFLCKSYLKTAWLDTACPQHRGRSAEIEFAGPGGQGALPRGGCGPSTIGGGKWPSHMPGTLGQNPLLIF